MGVVTAVFASFIPLLLSAVVQDSVPAVARDSAPVAAIERFIAAQMAQHAIPGLAIALVDGDRIIWAKGFGRLDPSDSTRRIAADTPFRVASVSKLFTDIGIMQRVERGRFALDSAVTDDHLERLTLYGFTRHRRLLRKRFAKGRRSYHGASTVASG